MSETISVIVPHYEDPVHLEICLRALADQTLKPDEIIVSDNNSPMGENAVRRVIGGRAKLTVTTEKGAGPARNGGVAVSTGQILAFTDSDCVPEPDWLRAGVAALNDFDFVGGRVKVLVDDATNLTGAEAFERVFAFDNKRYVLRKGFTGAGNLFCPRALFDRVGGFRVGLSEDLEWSKRATAAGYRLGYVDGAVVGHPARRHWSELKRKWQRLNTEQLGVYLERPRGRARFFIRSLALPLSALAHTPKVFRSKAIQGSQRWQALGTLYRLRLWRTMDCLRLAFVQK